MIGFYHQMAMYKKLPTKIEISVISSPTVFDTTWSSGLEQCFSTFLMSWTIFRRDFVLGPTSSKICFRRIIYSRKEVASKRKSV